MGNDSARAAQVLRDRGVTGPVDVGIVLGTGLGSIADSLEHAIVTAYDDLPGFPPAKVSGHEGSLAVGTIDGTPVAIMRGRAHYYEDGRADAMASALGTLALLGARSVVLTNSAGSLHADWVPGTLALIADHINFSGRNPLIGASGDDRFVALDQAYDRRLLDDLRRAARDAEVSPLHEGVYMWFAGPSFETPAEVRAAGVLGADLVGMSTVPETILARRLGLRVAAVSVITNFATGLAGGKPSHAETKDVAQQGSAALTRLLRAFLRAHDHGQG